MSARKDANPCDTCGGARFRVIFPDHPILDGPLVACGDCGLVQVNPPFGRYQIADTATRDARAAAYARQAAAVRTALQYRPEIEDAERTVRERCWIERLDRIEQVASRGRLLEIGSDGQFLRLAASRGWSVTGVQPDVGTCTQARTLHGIELTTATLSEARFPDASFDLVVMFHVIEHVASPKELCRESFRLLRPGGTLCVETPNVDTLWFRVLGSRWRQLIPDHYWFFSPATLRTLLGGLGYCVDRVDSVGKAVSLRLVLNRVERMAKRPLPMLAASLRWFRLSDRVLWITPGDVILAIARRPDDGQVACPPPAIGRALRSEM
jgi:2-polyprenyl-3-methyl-5-hydroxy-6-metoxy-1,4-benzoquinol methylase